MPIKTFCVPSLRGLSRYNSYPALLFISRSAKLSIWLYFFYFFPFSYMLVCIFHIFTHFFYYITLYFDLIHYRYIQNYYEKVSLLLWGMNVINFYQQHGLNIIDFIIFFFSTYLLYNTFNKKVFGLIFRLFEPRSHTHTHVVWYVKTYNRLLK